MIQAVGTSGIAMSTMQRAGPPPQPKEVFAKADSDESGALNVDELQAMLDELAEKIGSAVPTAEELLGKLDTDGDGEISSASSRRVGRRGRRRGHRRMRRAGRTATSSARDNNTSLGLLAYLDEENGRNTSILNIKV